MKTKRLTPLVGALSVVLGLSGAAAQTTNYPNQPIRMIVPFAPGGASDFVARIIQPKLGSFAGPANLR